VNQPIDISSWKSAPFDLADATVFAIGDVHGCADELTTLLSTIAELARDAAHPRRLVYLGDLIDRGPDNIGTLRLWAEDEGTRGVDRIDRLMGNHEQLLLLAADGGPHAAKAKTRWLTDSMGGQKVLDEMRRVAGDPSAELGRDLLDTALGQPVVQKLRAMSSHVSIGNTLFVHGGLDPKVPREQFLARPWTDFTEARWAWINQGFLEWKGGFGGTLVVHGHTPPAKHRAFTGQDDPHEFQHGRLGLDGGSALTGIVTAAEIRDGRYRILKAGRPRSPG
jgi:serine/threonine protein phosphatase 1